MKEFLNEIFCNLLLKIHIVAPIDHMFCVNHCWIYISFSKCVIFFQILHFILKIYHNFESYQNMLTTFSFCFLYHKLQLCFVCHAHYNPFKILKLHIFLIVSAFWAWVISYYHLIFFYHQNYVITIVLYLVLCKINHNLTQYLIKFKRVFKKPKPKI